MRGFFIRAAQQAKQDSDSRERIQLMQQMSDKKEWKFRDFAQFGQLMPVSHFRAEHDTSLYSIDDKCKDVMMYPRMYYIQLLTNGKWAYDSLFRKTLFAHQNLEVVEEFVYNEIKNGEKSST